MRTFGGSQRIRAFRLCVRGSLAGAHVRDKYRQVDIIA